MKSSWSQHPGLEAAEVMGVSGNPLGGPDPRGGRCSPRRWDLSHTQFVQQTPLLTVAPLKGMPRAVSVAIFPRKVLTEVPL